MLIPLTENLPTVLSILNSSLLGGTIGLAYTEIPQAAGGAPPYAWSISSGSLPNGLAINSASGAITGTPTTAGTSSFTLKVTDSANPPAMATANLSITIPPKLVITTTSLPSVSAGGVYQQAVQAVGGIPPYTFSLPLGSFVPQHMALYTSGLIAGIPWTTGTSNFTVEVTDSTPNGGVSATANVSLDVTAANCPNNGSFQHNYAFQLVGAGLWIGSFVTDSSGNIPTGEADNDVQATFGLSGNYCIGANNRGTMMLTRNDLNIAFLFLLALDSSGNALVTSYPPQQGQTTIPQAFSGNLWKQDTTAFSTSKIVGAYDFGLLGAAASEAGTFSADGTGNITSGEFDLNAVLLGPASVNTVFSASNLSVGSDGRGTVTLDTTTLGTSDVIFYVVNGSRLVALQKVNFFLNSLPVSVLLVGPVVQSASGFTNASLSGASVFALQQSGVINPSGSIAQVGLITWDGGGNFTLSADQNSAGALSVPAYSGTYSVTSNGRVTLTANGQSTPILYLTGPNQGFAVGTDNNLYGQIFGQSGAPFGDSSFSGNYVGLNWFLINVNSNVNLTQVLDNLAADGAGNLTGTSDVIDFVNGPSSTPVAATYSVSSAGRGVVSQNGATTGILYVVSPPQVVLLPSTGNFPTLITLSHP
jgi:hypothetical protein